MKIFRLFLILGFCFSFTASRSQDFREKFSQGNYHIEFGDYALAVEVFSELLKEQPDNANLNYKVGFSQLKTNRNKAKAIPFLEKAVKDVSANYDDLEPSETKAPIAAWYYLAVAYRVGNKLDQAVETFNKFKEVAGKKHYLQEEADHEIQIVKNAREFMAAPVKVEVENLGDSVNTEFREFAPVVSIDEQAIYFTAIRPDNTGKQRDATGQYFSDIYVSQKDADGYWSKAVSIGSNINTPDHEATMSLSANGQNLFIYEGLDQGSIYVSELVGNEWSVPIKFPSDVNSQHVETHATLASDGRTMYFVSNRPGGMGGLDIWMVKKLPNGNWGKAQNLGATINTKYDEDGPFLSADMKELYFCSKGHKNMGGFDIFVSRLGDDNKWGTPTNVGYPINSTDDDAFFMPTADGRRAFLSSIHEEGKGEEDIYMVTMVEAVERAFTVLIGHIRPKKGQTLPEGIEIHVSGGNLEQDEIFKPNSLTGKYIIPLSPGSYHFSYRFNEKEFYVDDIFVPEESAYQKIQKEIELNMLDLSAIVKDAGKDTTATTDQPDPKEKDKAAPVTDLPDNVKKLSTSYKETFSYNVKNIKVDSPEFKAFLDSVSMIIQTKGVANVTVESSASKVPTRKYRNNEELTRARAKAAKEVLTDALKKRDIDTSKVKFVSTSSLVQGPKYQGDADRGKEKYEKFQYVRFVVR